MSNKFVQTDIGYIPVGWKPCRVGELVSFSGGSQPDKSVFKFRSAEGYIRLIQIRDYKTDKYESYIPEGLARKTCDESDVMIGRYGPPIFQILRGIKGAYNVALIKAIPSDELDKDFFYHFIQNEDLFSLMEILSRRSSGQTGVDLPALKDYPLPLPPKKEQAAIAKNLSDTDALITSLEKLIGKKRAIKTATMQQLLTGKKRLQPFGKSHAGYKETELGVVPEGWGIDSLSQLTVLMTNGFVGTAKTHYTDGQDGVLYVQGYNVEENGFNYRGIKRVTNEFHRQHSKSCLREGDVLMVQTGDVGLTTIVPEELVGANCHALIIMRFKLSNFDPLFFTYYLNSKHGRSRLKELEVGTTMKHINVGDLLHFTVPFPTMIEEQQAISNTLAAMDDDISLLGERLAKVQKLKQGMMQELLTGKKRLLAGTV